MAWHETIRAVEAQLPQLLNVDVATASGSEYVADHQADPSNPTDPLGGSRTAPTCSVSVRWAVGDCVHRNRNRLAAQFLADDYDLIFWFDSDMGLVDPAPTLARMIRMNLPIVGINYPHRRYNWRRMQGQSREEVQRSLLIPTVQQIPEVVDPPTRNGAVQCWRLGLGGLLVRREVYVDLIRRDLVEKMWHANNLHPRFLPFFYRFHFFKVVDGDDLGEDYIFCDLARRDCLSYDQFTPKPGFDLYYDPQAKAIHVGEEKYGEVKAG